MNKIKLTVLMLLTAFMISGTAIDVSASSLDDITKGNSSDSGVLSNKTMSGEDYIKDIQGKADLSKYNTAGADKVNAKAGAIGANIVKVLGYLAVVGLTVRIALDLVYIGLPFCRGLLGGDVAQQQQAGGFGGGGFGGNSFGGGGFGGGGFGGNRFGGGSSFGGGNSFGGAGGFGGEQQAAGGKNLVSNAAKMAVSMGSQPGPDGKPMNPLKAYAKDMIVLLVGVPILFTLAVSGVLSNLGFLIGKTLSIAIASIGNIM